MPASIGVNLRVTGHCSQGGRKYMEDLFSVAYQQTEDERDLEYAFFGIYDGHGGSEAAAFAKEHLMDSIVKQRQFWSDNDEDVLKAIRNGYMLTHLNMWKEIEKWPKTVTGLPSTAGTTASIAFIRRGKIYIGHVGDSAIVLGYRKEGSEEWSAKPLTLDHKPESGAEMERIQRCGGKVINKAGVPRVVWNRPRPGHKGPIKDNTPMDEIPFLAVARSLGDLWSYNTQNDEFIVSPDPDVGVLNIDASKFRCLIFGTDGLWNMLSPEEAVGVVQGTERHNEAALVGAGGQPQDWHNPSKSLVDKALEKWSSTRMRADNTSVVTLMLDPPGPPRATVLRSRTAQPRPQTTQTTESKESEKADTNVAPSDDRQVPQNGLTIMTRYVTDPDRAPASPAPEAPAPTTPLPPCATIDTRFSPAEPIHDAITNYGNPAESYFMARLLNRNRIVNTLCDVFGEDSNRRSPSPRPTALTETSVHDTHEDAGDTKDTSDKTELETTPREDGGIQINEVSSSSPTDLPKPRGRRPKTESKREEGNPNGRVLRSHDSEPVSVPRPHTRQRRARIAPTQPSPSLDRVVILSRARGVAAPPPPPIGRATRSKDVVKVTRGISGRGQIPVAGAVAVAGAGAAGKGRQGNCLRATGTARRGAAGGRRAPQTPPPRPARPDCSKENMARPRRVARDADHVHSTSGEGDERLKPRALRSRNEAECGAACPKRLLRHSEQGDEARSCKAPRLLSPAAAPPSLRHRLRKRLSK